MAYDIGAYVMSHYEIEEMCREAWSEKFNYLCLCMTKIKTECKVCFCNGSKSLALNVLRKESLFDYNKGCFQLNKEVI